MSFCRRSGLIILLISVSIQRDQSQGQFPTLMYLICYTWTYLHVLKSTKKHWGHQGSMSLVNLLIKWYCIGQQNKKTQTLGGKGTAIISKEIFSEMDFQYIINTRHFVSTFLCVRHSPHNAVRWCNSHLERKLVNLQLLASILPLPCIEGWYLNHIIPASPLASISQLYLVVMIS